jgi:uncharacterized protein YgiB involved in biofilm formation
MKRSKFIGLALMGSSPFLLTACQEPAPPAPQMPTYGSVQECIDAGIFTPQACETSQAAALAVHQQEGPRFAERSACEQEFGAANCQQVHTHSGSWFMPAMAGFMIGQALADRDGYYGNRGYRGRPLYRDRYSTDTWRTADNRTVSKSNKAITSTRGGFGSRAAARGSWGS